MNKLEMFEAHMKKEHPFIDVKSEAYAAMRNLWKARVPEGYVVVPKEPTFKQIDALKNSCEILRKTGLSDLEANGAYKAMIEAVEK